MKNLIVLLLAFVSLPSFSQKTDLNYILSDMDSIHSDLVAFKQICPQKIDQIELLDRPRVLYAAVTNERITSLIDKQTRRIKWKNRGESQFGDLIAKDANKIRLYSAFYALLATDELSDKTLLKFASKAKSELTSRHCQGAQYTYKRYVDFVLQHDMDR